jgi:Domain of unknown function (DUF4145)
MHQPYKAPKFWESSFHCPLCGAFAEQVWGDYTFTTKNRGQTKVGVANDLSVAFCSHCRDYSLWLESKSTMIYPFSGTASLPNADLPEHIRQDYLEARDIAAISPRGAAALLRLCIQKLCIHLGEPGRDLNSDIGALVKKGLNPTIQKSLDIVRVIGNESVHPGSIDLRDDPQTSSRLFMLINIIADVLITQPKMIEETYGVIPEGKRDGIEKRDGTTKS